MDYFINLFHSTFFLFGGGETNLGHLVPPPEPP